MENKPAFDTFLASKLKQHRVEPSPDAKALFLQRAQREKALRSKRILRNTLFLAAVAACIIGIVWISGLWPSNYAPQTIQPLVVDSSTSPASSAQPSTPSASTQAPQAEPTAKTSANTNSLSDNTDVNSTSKPITQTKSVSVVTKVQSPAVSLENEQQTPQPTTNWSSLLHPMPINKPTAFAISSTSAISTIAPRKNLKVKTFVPDEVVLKDSLKEVKIAPYIIPRSSKQLSVGLQYTPEWMFNTVDQKSKYVHNLGLEASYRIERYSIRTGIGLSIAQGVSEIAYEYHNYLSTYKRLDSIKFTFDAQNHKVNPEYYLSDQDLFDTAKSTNVSYIEKRYTYLQLPLILGYDVIQSKRTTLGLRAGPMLSILIHEKESDDAYNPGKDLVLNVNNLTPDRVKTNWQAVLGLNAGYRFNRMFGFEIEPQFKYYFNSVYEKASTTQKPYSFEVRAALLISLSN
jgi:hypothetical protein